MRRTAIIAIHGGVLLVGTLIAFHPTICSGGRLMQTDPGDTLLNHYILEHEWKWLSDSTYQASFWSPAFYHPTPNVLAYSEHLLGCAPIYWMYRCIAGEVTAYQSWMITVTALTYISMAWVLRRLSVNHCLSALGAAAFAFGLPRVAQMSHQQLLPAFYSPLAVYSAWRFFESPSRSKMICIIIFTYVQLLASFYLGWLLALGLSIFASTTLVCDGEIRSRVFAFLKIHWVGAFGTATVTTLALVATMWPYFGANSGFRRHFSEVRLMLPRVESWVSPPPSSLWAGVLPSVTGPLSHEHHLFPGLLFCILTLVTLIVWIHRRDLPSLARLALMTMFILMLISLSFSKITVWRLVFGYMPGAQAIRAVTRIFSIVLLFGWIAVSVALTRVLNHMPRTAYWISALLLTLSLVELAQPRLPAFNPAPFFAEAQTLAEQMSGAKLVYVEPDRESAAWVSELAAMWAGLRANVPVVNGNSGRKPKDYPDGVLDSGALAKWLGSCNDIRVIGPARLAHAYPMPNQQLRPMPILHAQRDN